MQNPAPPDAHFAAVFRWSPEARFDRRRLLISLLAMAVPIVAGLCLDKPGLGYVIALGAMLLGTEPGENTGGSHTLAGSLLPAAVAVLIASGIARLQMGEAEAVMIVLVTAAATLVNYSRPAAISGIRFIVLLVLNVNLIASHGAQGRGAALMFGVGALWRLALRVMAGRRQAEATPARAPTPRQRRIHFGRMLRMLEGWQYPLRLAIGLAAACLLRDLWPQHHYDWIVLSVVLVTPRALEHLPVHITQRAIGTLAGVALTGAILHFTPGHIAIAVLVCLFGTAAPLLRAGNYAAYCVFATPLILLAMDAGGALSNAMLVDRLVATLAGSAIVVSANLVVDAALRLRRSI